MVIFFRYLDLMFEINDLYSNILIIIYEFIQVKKYMENMLSVLALPKYLLN